MIEPKPETSARPTAGVTPARALVVGLGNPGRAYVGNRHNVGFMTVVALASAHGISLTRSRASTIYGDGQIVGVPVILAKPQTYMNLSGQAVAALIRFFRVPLDRLLVIYDELDLPFGTLRLRQHGGAGGHNGMRSIIQHLGNDFPRLRLGIGRPPGRLPPAAYVLQDFSREEREALDVVLAEAARAVESFLSVGIELAMTRHNGLVLPDEDLSGPV